MLGLEQIELQMAVYVPSLRQTSLCIKVCSAIGNIT